MINQNSSYDKYGSSVKCQLRSRSHIYRLTTWYPSGIYVIDVL